VHHAEQFSVMAKLVKLFRLTEIGLQLVV
jgi:hypothetical protein